MSDKRISFQPVVVSARIHKRNGGDYRSKDEWQGGFLITLTGDVAYASHLTGVCDGDECTWDRQTDNETVEYCKSIGAKWLEYEIKGKQIRRKIGRNNGSGS